MDQVTDSELDDKRFDPMTCTEAAFLAYLCREKIYTEEEIEFMRSGADLITGRPKWPTRVSSLHQQRPTSITSSGATRQVRTTQQSTAEPV